MATPEKITRSIIVKRDVGGAYSLWTDFESFPQFMKHIKSVRKTGPETSHWVMDGPIGKDIEWDAEITDLEEDKRIAWHSTGGDIKTSGQVTFTELANGETQINVQMQYVAPAGALGKAASHLFDNPEKKLEEDLQKFKTYAEVPARVR